GGSGGVTAGGTGSGGVNSTGGTGGAGGLTGTGATGGTPEVDLRCPALKPDIPGVCDVEQLRCTYDYLSGCLCTGVAMGICPKVDPDCPSVSGKVAPFAPPPETGGSGSGAPLPPSEVCVCSAGSWSCTIGI
ncbi:MAG: hypothetical protein JW940_11210, partial [Polyangiaceae bacterium]|nr:hypothetical protein [Polyangiaceae bacterium]